MNITPTVNVLLSLGVIVSQVFLVVSLLYLFLFKKEQTPFSAFLGRHGMLLAFLVALISTSSSLFYSQIAGFTPCELCWFQRIFMYPEVILLGLALVKKDFHITDYALSLTIIGTLISLYHNYVYYYNQGLNAYCQLGGVQVSCVKRYMLEFGYITIPMMALTGFLLILFFLLMYRRAHTLRSFNSMMPR